LRRVRDFAMVEEAEIVDEKIADQALRQLEVDTQGLDALDHRYLNCIAINYDGGPVGIETIAAALSEPRDALEEIVEAHKYVDKGHKKGNVVVTVQWDNKL